MDVSGSCVYSFSFDILNSTQDYDIIVTSCNSCFVVCVTSRVVSCCDVTQSAVPGASGRAGPSARCHARADSARDGERATTHRHVTAAPSAQARPSRSTTATLSLAPVSTSPHHLESVRALPR